MGKQVTVAKQISAPGVPSSALYTLGATVVLSDAQYAELTADVIACLSGITTVDDPSTPSSGGSSTDAAWFNIQGITMTDDSFVQFMYVNIVDSGVRGTDLSVIADGDGSVSIVSASGGTFQCWVHTYLIATLDAGSTAARVVTTEMTTESHGTDFYPPGLDEDLVFTKSASQQRSAGSYPLGPVPPGQAVWWGENSGWNVNGTTGTDTITGEVRVVVWRIADLAS